MRLNRTYERLVDSDVGPFSLLLFLTIALAGAFLAQAMAIAATPGERRRHDRPPREPSPADSLAAG